MTHSKIVADLAALAGNVSPEAKFLDAIERLWAAFARTVADNHHVELVVASAEMAARARRNEPMVFILAAYTEIEKIWRASDFPMKKELDTALRDLARELADNLPLKRDRP